MLDELGFHRLDVERHGQGRERLRLHRVDRTGNRPARYSVPRRIKYPTSTPTPRAMTNDAARLSFIISSASCTVSYARPRAWPNRRLAILMKEAVRSLR